MTHDADKSGPTHKHDSAFPQEEWGGMNMREWYAGLAMHALLSRRANAGCAEVMHAAAVLHADSLIDALNAADKADYP